MSLSLKQRMIARAKALGVLIIDDGAAIRIDAPRKSVFVATGLHFHDYYIEPGKPRASAYKAALEDMSHGVERCTRVEDGEPWCDNCDEDMSHEQIHHQFPGERLA